jgi:hypothetical protein
MLTLEGVAAAARHRHGPKIEDEGHLKDFDIISFLLTYFILFNVSFNTKVLFVKNIFWNGGIFISMQTSPSKKFRCGSSDGANYFFQKKILSHSISLSNDAHNYLLSYSPHLQIVQTIRIKASLQTPRLTV